MNCLAASEAKKNLYELIDEVSLSHEPKLIKGKRNSVVLISEEDWSDIEETLYIYSQKDLAKSIKTASNEPLSDSSDRINL